MEKLKNDSIRAKNKSKGLRTYTYPRFYTPRYNEVIELIKSMKFKTEIKKYNTSDDDELNIFNIIPYIFGSMLGL
jgi:beta-lactam-binding protein with PASTA domain